MVIKTGVAYVGFMYNELEVKAANFCQKVHWESLRMRRYLVISRYSNCRSFQAKVYWTRTVEDSGRFYLSGRWSCHFYSWKHVFKMYRTESLRRRRLQESLVCLTPHHDVFSELSLSSSSLWPVRYRVIVYSRWFVLFCFVYLACLFTLLAFSPPFRAKKTRFQK